VGYPPRKLTVQTRHDVSFISAENEPLKRKNTKGYRFDQEILTKETMHISQKEKEKAIL
jgi:hypothetical protein